VQVFDWPNKNKICVNRVKTEKGVRGVAAQHGLDCHPRCPTKDECFAGDQAHYHLSQGVRQKNHDSERQFK
jgi:hypothetical protein